MATLIKYKCTRCNHTTEQYSYVKNVYHHDCPQTKRGEIAVVMAPVVKESR